MSLKLSVVKVDFYKGKLVFFANNVKNAKNASSVAVKGYKTDSYMLQLKPRNSHMLRLSLAASPICRNSHML